GIGGAFKVWGVIGCYSSFTSKHFEQHVVGLFHGKLKLLSKWCGTNFGGGFNVAGLVQLTGIAELDVKPLSGCQVGEPLSKCPTGVASAVFDCCVVVTGVGIKTAVCVERIDR